MGRAKAVEGLVMIVVAMMEFRSAGGERESGEMVYMSGREIRVPGKWKALRQRRR